MAVGFEPKHCACWAQATSNTEPRLSKHYAEVAFGAQHFELKLVQESCTIAVVEKDRAMEAGSTTDDDDQPATPPVTYAMAPATLL